MTGARQEQLRRRRDRRRDGGHGGGAVRRGTRSVVHPGRQRRRHPVRERTARSAGRAPRGRASPVAHPLTRPWRRSRSDEPDHPLARVDAGVDPHGVRDLRRGPGRGGPALRPAGCGRTASVLTSIGTIKTTFGVPRSMVAGVAALDARPPCLLVDFRGLREFSARQIVATLGDRWPGLRHRRIEFPGFDAAPELYAAHLARALEIAGDARADDRPGEAAAGRRAGGRVPGGARPRARAPRSTPRSRRRSACRCSRSRPCRHRCPGCGCWRRWRRRWPAAASTGATRHGVRALAFDADGERRPRSSSTAIRMRRRGERVVARAVVLATGRFSGRGLVADRAWRPRERPRLARAPARPRARRGTGATSSIRRATRSTAPGLHVDDAWRPLDADGKPGVATARTPSAPFSPTRTGCAPSAAPGLAIATAWAAVGPGGARPPRPPERPRSMMSSPLFQTGSPRGAGAVRAGPAWRASAWFRIRIGPDARAVTPLGRVAAALRGDGRRRSFSRRVPDVLGAFFLDVLLLRRLFATAKLRWLAHLLIVVGFTLLLLMHALAPLVTARLFPGYQPTLDPYLFLRNLFGAMVLVGVALLSVGRAASRTSSSPRRAPPRSRVVRGAARVRDRQRVPARGAQDRLAARFRPHGRAVRRRDRSGKARAAARALGPRVRRGVRATWRDRSIRRWSSKAAICTAKPARPATPVPHPRSSPIRSPG